MESILDSLSLEQDHDAELEKRLMELAITPTRACQNVAFADTCLEDHCMPWQRPAANEEIVGVPPTSSQSDSRTSEAEFVDIMASCPVCCRANRPLLCSTCVHEITATAKKGLKLMTNTRDKMQEKVLCKMQSRAPFLERLQQRQQAARAVSAMDEMLVNARNLLQKEQNALAALKEEQKRLQRQTAKLRARHEELQKRKARWKSDLAAKHSKLQENLTVKLPALRRKFMLDWSEVFEPTGPVPATSLAWPVRLQHLLAESGCDFQLLLSSNRSAGHAAMSGQHDDGEPHEDLEAPEEVQYCSIAGIPLPRAIDVWELAVKARLGLWSSSDPSLETIELVPELMTATRASLLTLCWALSVLSKALHFPMPLPALDSPAFHTDSMRYSLVHDAMVEVDTCVIALCSHQLAYQGQRIEEAEGTSVMDILQQDLPLFNLKACISDKNPHLGYSGPYTLNESLVLPVESSNNVEEDYVEVSLPPEVKAKERGEDMTDVGRDWEDVGKTDIPLAPEESSQDAGIMSRSYKFITNFSFFPQ